MNAYRLNEHLQGFSFSVFRCAPSDLKGRRRRHHRVEETRFYKINNVQKKKNNKRGESR